MCDNVGMVVSDCRMERNPSKIKVENKQQRNTFVIEFTTQLKWYRMLSDDRSFASKFLDKHPNIRAIVTQSIGFDNWKRQFQTVIIDDIKFYLLGGPVRSEETYSSDSPPKFNPGSDQLLEEDELIYQWAKNHGILPEQDK